MNITKHYKASVFLGSALEDIKNEKITLRLNTT